MKKTNISVEPEHCARCYSCQYRCSLAYTGSFNPEKSRLIIDPPDRILFTDECITGCSLCARYCHYGALSITKEFVRN